MQVIKVLFSIVIYIVATSVALFAGMVSLIHDFMCWLSITLMIEALKLSGDLVEQEDLKELFIAKGYNV